MNPAIELPSQAPARAKPRLVSAWWRTGAVIIVILVLILAIFPFAIQRQETVSAVHWSRFLAPGGPGTEGSNLTEIHSDTFCAPSNALSVGLFSMTWTASNGTRVSDVRLWTPDPNLPFPNILYLYHGYNESGGGTSFESPYPIPCGNMWVLDDDSTVPVTITAVMTLTYNYTATVPAYFFP
jgi:hypothetical protein